MGGHLLGGYNDPLGKQPVLVAILPIDSVEPTPFQRDLSQAHHRKLADVLDRTGMFLDPIIAVTAPEKGFWTPNGMHRLMAMRRLGATRHHRAGRAEARDRLADPRAQHREGAQPAREVARGDPHLPRPARRGRRARRRTDFAFYLEEASLVTLGICYEQNGKFAGGAYNPIVRRLEKFSDEPICQGDQGAREARRAADGLDERVAAVVAKLKAKGFVSPYLRAFVVARINPLRWIQGEPPPLEEVLKTMRDRAARFNVEKIKQADLANMGGAPDDSGLAGSFCSDSFRWLHGRQGLSPVATAGTQPAAVGYSRKERL